MLILWRPSCTFLENSKIAQNQQEVGQNIENVSNLHKLSIWIKKRENKMYFKQIYVKIVKTAFKNWLPWQRLNWYGFNQHTIVFLEKFYEKSLNFVAITVSVAKIRIFEISAGTLRPPPLPPCTMKFRTCSKAI